MTRAEIQRRYQKKHSRAISTRQKEERRKLRATVIAHYGGKCKCCGEDRPEFLCIDHIDGGGTKQRKDNGLLGTYFYKWIIRNKFPENLRVLCHNCNLSYAFAGYCPHNINSVFIGE